MMSGAEAMAIFNGALKLLEHVPEMAAPLEELVQAVYQRKDPSPAVKHAEVVAARKFLGI